MTTFTRRAWIEPTSQPIGDSVIEACGGDPFLAHTLQQRGFTDPQKIRGFLSPDAYSPAAPEQLPDLEQGAQLLQGAIAAHYTILIWGDFDVDGQTATALLMDGLQRLDMQVIYYLPDRNIDSHGIKRFRLEQQIAAHHPDLLLTCDTGISEFEALDYARTAGVKVIVTDHHELTDRLPNADAVINPRRLPTPSHPLANLPGVGVAYKLMQHLYTSLGRERELPRLLDLVALGIVGDVATQTDDTRYLLQIGLERLRDTGRIGLKSLMEVANLNPQTLTGSQIGYQLGPRLNAAGRLADARLSVELLTTRDSARARLLAQQLEGLNNERRLQTRQIEAAAEAMIRENPALLDSPALVLYQSEWNAGIIGIVASHLAEHYARPVVLLSGQDFARGSVRSPGGYNVNRALTTIGDMLRTYGGHMSAAGLSLEIPAIDRFRDRFSRALATAKITDMPDTFPVQIDAVLSVDQITLDLAQRIQRLAPFGQGNPEVLLMLPRVRLAHAAAIGRDAQHRRLTVEDKQGRQQTILWWNSAADVLPEGEFDVAFTLSVNERQELQPTLIDYREHAETITVAAPAIELTDWRNEHDPFGLLAHLLREQPDSVVWAEAESRKAHPNWKRRAELKACATLVIYTAPPDPLTLREVLRIVQPKKVFVIGKNPAYAANAGNTNTFLELLARAVQNALDHHRGETTAAILCGATAAPEPLLRAGLDYLTAAGRIGGVIWTAGIVQIAPVSRKSPKASAGDLFFRVQSLLLETDAYRRYFRGAPMERLLPR